MKIHKSVFFIVFYLLLLFTSGAQKSHTIYPFKGFHIAITGQAEFIQKPTFVALTGIDFAPLGRWTYGWEAGVEISYHFAKYLGISAGITYGTSVSYGRAFDISNFPIPSMMRGKINRNHSSVAEMKDIEMLFPVKLEFHYPLYKFLFFAAETGIKIKGVDGRLTYLRHGVDEKIYGAGYSYSDPDDYDPETGERYGKPYYQDRGFRKVSKVSCDMILGLGLYYKLPYGDLLRFTTGVNISFTPIVEGYYKYYHYVEEIPDSYGTFSVKNGFIYTQLSYIHTFNWQKARIFLKKNNVSFASNKERRKQVIEIINN